MYRIDSANTSPTIPTPSAFGTEAYYEDREAKVGDGTTWGADWLNMLMLSVLDVLDDQSIGHSKTDYEQLTDALEVKIADEAPPEPNATTSAPGRLRVATDAEVLAMAATTRVIAPSSFGSTPLGAGSGLDGWAALVGDPTYDRFIVQAVTTTRTGSGNEYHYWPVDFASSSYSVILGGFPENLGWSSRTQGSVNVFAGGAGTVSAIAFGPRYI